MPGLYGVIVMDAASAAASEEAGRILTAMGRALRHTETQRERDRWSEGSFHLAVHGYPSPCHRVLRSRPGNPRELWFGEVYEGRRVIDEAPAGGHSDGALDPPRYFDDDGLAPPGRSGANALARIAGAFAGIRFDPDDGAFEIFTDVVGSIPVFTRRAGPFLLVAPETKALLVTRTDELEGDRHALAFFLACGFLPPGRTHFAGVDGLPPGAILSGRAAPRHGATGEAPAPTVRRYWELRYEAGPRADSKALLGTLTRTLDDVVGSQLRGRERTGVLLSGGYDSRGLLGAALRAGARISTVTWGYDDQLPGGDAAIARELAKAAGVPHRFVSLDHRALAENAERWVWMTDGSVDAASNYPEADGVFARLAADFDVLVRGDECFGMKWPYGIPNERVARACIGVYPFAWHAIMDRLVASASRARLADACDRTQESLGADVRGVHPVDRKDEYYFKVRYRAYLNPLNYFKMQTVAMRSPLLDRRVLELVQTLPRSVRRSKNLFKTAVTEILAPFPVPFAHATSLIPWREVARSDAHVGGFFRERILADGGLYEWLDRRGVEKQIEEWLGSVQAPSTGAPRRGAELRRRLTHAGKRLAYDRRTPEALRRRLVPARNVRRSFDYAFRLLVLAIYVDRLRREGVVLRWK